MLGQTMVQMRDDVVGLDSAIFMSPEFREASGHVKGFSDPLTECKKYRTDYVWTACWRVYGIFADEKMSEDELIKFFKIIREDKMS